METPPNKTVTMGQTTPINEETMEIDTPPNQMGSETIQVVRNAHKHTFYPFSNKNLYRFAHLDLYNS